MRFKENYINKFEQYSRGELKCIFSDLSIHHINSIKSIVDHFSNYLNHKVLVNFKKIPQHNPGLHSMLLPKFRTPEHYDSITINADFENKSQIPYYFIHELGHALQFQIEEITKSENLDIYPSGKNIEDEYFEDYQYGEFQADFLVAYIVNPEFVKNNVKNDIQKNMIKVFDKLFIGNNFKELRESLYNNDLKYQQEVEEQVRTNKIDKPVWMEEGYENVPIYYRAFDEEVNKRYKDYFDDLEKKYQSTT